MFNRMLKPANFPESTGTDAGREALKIGCGIIMAMKVSNRVDWLALVWLPAQ